MVQCRVKRARGTMRLELCGWSMVGREWGSMQAFVVPKNVATQDKTTTATATCWEFAEAARSAWRFLSCVRIKSKTECAD